MPIVSASVPSSLPPSGSAGGDLGGTYPNPSVDLMTGGSIVGDLIVKNASANDMMYAIEGQSAGLNYFDGAASTATSSVSASSGSASISAASGGDFAAGVYALPSGRIVIYSGAAFDVPLQALPNGIILTGTHAAPADGALAAGDVALWFDQTNGVGNTKLMLKGKSADGTVKTASILLA